MVPLLLDREAGGLFDDSGLTSTWTPYAGRRTCRRGGGAALGGLLVPGGAVPRAVSVLGTGWPHHARLQETQELIPSASLSLRTPWVFIVHQMLWRPASRRGDHSVYVADTCKRKGRRASRAFTIGGGLLHAGVVPGNEGR